MRIISGQFKGRKFAPPSNKKYPTRPTTDFAKEALFNILQHQIDFESVTLLDLFGGFGGISLEFISRGCTDVTFVDRSHDCCSFIKDVTSKLDIEEYIKIVKSDVKQFLKYNKTKFDIVLADPPYELSGVAFLPEMILKNDLLKDGGMFIFEHNSNHDFKKLPQYKETRSYGKSYFSFFE